MEKIGGQRNHQELRSVNRVRRWLWGEEKVNATIKNYAVQCERCQAATAWRGKKRSTPPSSTLAARTVSGGGCGERNKKSISPRSTWTRTSQCKPGQEAAVGRGKGQRDHQELRSVNRVRRRLCGEERKYQRNHQVHLQRRPCQAADVGKEMKKRSTWIRTSQCEPCQAAAGGRGKGQRNHQELRSVNRVRRRLCGEEIKGHCDQQELRSVNRVRRRLRRGKKERKRKRNTNTSGGRYEEKGERKGQCNH
jgi:hypothetical protein